MQVHFICKNHKKTCNITSIISMYKFFTGASVEVSETKIQANSLLHSAIQSDSCHKLQVVKLLLDKSCDPNGRRLGNLDTPVHIAAKHGHLDILKV